MGNTNNNFVDIIKEATEGILSEESLVAVQEAFDKAVDEKSTLNIEAALVSQDAEYADKLQSLLETIDGNHTGKLLKLAEAIDTNNAVKLNRVVKKYKTALANEAAQFKKSLVKSMSRYLEVYLEQAIPQEFINKAVIERKAQHVLENLRQHLAIDSALMGESIRTAVIDGKNQINEAHTELEKVQRRARLLEEKLVKSQADLILTEKTSTLPIKKREYVKRVLDGKSATFIAENIDYTIGLFDRTERDQVDFLREQAMHDIVATDDAPADSRIVEESSQFTSQTCSPYLQELSKY
jgi:hypothetical protein